MDLLDLALCSLGAERMWCSRASKSLAAAGVLAALEQSPEHLNTDISSSVPKLGEHRCTDATASWRRTVTGSPGCSVRPPPHVGFDEQSLALLEPVLGSHGLACRESGRGLRRYLELMPASWRP